ncbi:MAG: DUF6065 family protein [Alphaproteobacteria bacterium]|nr:DUF6065 family protein [Alphaproteobacteria bacterium]
MVAENEISDEMGTGLRCYSLTENAGQIVPADPSRQWMDNFPDRHAYRCLPLAIANSYGWNILSPYEFSIEWTGGPEAEALSFTLLGDGKYLEHFVASNFTRGIVTFHTGFLFRTDPGWDLMVTGPANHPKAGIAPLTGIIETDWLPYPFTMNWQMTQPGSVRFKLGEPICTVFPLRRGVLDSIEPVVLDLDDDLELKGQYKAWGDKRRQYMEKFDQQDPATLKQAWQRFYFKGEYPDSDDQVAGHKRKLRLTEPVDKRSSRVVSFE